MQIVKLGRLTLQENWPFVDVGVLVDDIVGGLEQGELVLQLVVDQQLVHLLGGDDTLGRLAVKQLLLGFPSVNLVLDHVTSNLDVSTTRTGSDQVSNTGRFLSEGGWVWCRQALDVELFPVGRETDSLGKTDSHDGRLGIVTPAGALDETSGTGDDILQGTGDGCANDVLDDSNVEVCSVESFLQDVLIDILTFATEVVWDIVGNRGLGPSASSNLVGNVGTGKNTTVDAQSVSNGLRQQFAAISINLLRQEIALAVGLTLPINCLHVFGRNW